MCTLYIRIQFSFHCQKNTFKGWFLKLGCHFFSTWHYLKHSSICTTGQVVKVNNIYTFVEEGDIDIVRMLCDVSGDNNWIVRKFPIVAEEKNSTIEIQFLKNQSVQIRNNNVVVIVRNQYGISLPFYVVPIGGVPVYSPKIRMK